MSRDAHIGQNAILESLHRPGMDQFHVIEHGLHRQRGRPQVLRDLQHRLGHQARHPVGTRLPQMLWRRFPPGRELDPVEIALIVLLSLVLSFLATLYPAWKAASTDPVEVLRYE